MTQIVTFRAGAEADLDGIFEHVAADSLDRAIGYARRIRKRCQDLAEFPNAGRDRPELGPGLRSIAFEKRILIVYAIGDGVIEIVRVLYGGRDVHALLGEDEPPP